MLAIFFSVSFVSTRLRVLNGVDLYSNFIPCCDRFFSFYHSISLVVQVFYDRDFILRRHWRRDLFERSCVNCGISMGAPIGRIFSESDKAVLLFTERERVSSYFNPPDTKDENFYTGLKNIYQV